MKQTKTLTNREYLVAVFFILTVLTLFLTLTGCGPSRGDVGDRGAAGHSPVVTTKPATLSQCPAGGLEIDVDGVNSGVTCNGIAGAPGQSIIGPKGDKGDQGNPGVDITPITFVNFCTAPTVYPNTFTELGFCIGGNLYGVYSANSGFMVLMPPGNYVSNGINSSCNFTVSANCAISH